MQIVLTGSLTWSSIGGQGWPTNHLQPLPPRLAPPLTSPPILSGAVPTHACTRPLVVNIIGHLIQETGPHWNARA